MSRLEDRSLPARGLGGRHSLKVDPERLERFLACGVTERVTRAQGWQINVGEMLRWAARCPDEVPLVNGEFFFIAESLADNEVSRPTPRRREGPAMGRPGAALAEPRPARRAPTAGRGVGAGR